MNFDTIYETIPANGWLTKEEARLLWHQAYDCEGPILEVGSYEGRSTVLLASLGRLVYAVDPFDGFADDRSGNEIEACFTNNIQSRHIDNVRLFRQKIEEWKPRPCGFAYLDGDHTYQGTLRQIGTAKKVGAKVICIHDYATEGGGAFVKKAIEDSQLKIVNLVERMAHCIVE